ncbi:MAG TPA: PH domain-containing protein [Vicinamibacterales bacterium]|nr:PH domain-containing protein [Vicinamibacterales bacterium]
MAYVDKHLLSGERVIYRSRQHLVVFIGPVLLVVIAIIPLVISRRNAMLVLASILFVAGLIWLVARAIARASAEFTVTNKRVVVKLGTIRRRAIEMLLSKVEEIAVDQGVVGRMLGYGTVVIVGTGGSKEVFMLIANPLEFRRQVQEQIERHAAELSRGQ